MQFEVRLPAQSTVNDAHIIMEHVTETASSLAFVVLKVEGITMDETSISCENIPHFYEIISRKESRMQQLNCQDIVNHTVIIDYHTNYTCNYTVDCQNLDPLKNSPKWINVNTTLTEKKQRLFCQEVNQTTNKILCQCDFPTHIYDADDWIISV